VGHRIGATTKLPSLQRLSRLAVCAAPSCMQDPLLLWGGRQSAGVHVAVCGKHVLCERASLTTRRPVQTKPHYGIESSSTRVPRGRATSVPPPDPRRPFHQPEEPHPRRHNAPRRRRFSARCLHHHYSSDSFRTRPREDRALNRTAGEPRMPCNHASW
jgi:hypothetical protein